LFLLSTDDFVTKVSDTLEIRHRLVFMTEGLETEWTDLLPGSSRDLESKWTGLAPGSNTLGA
jgi:hypothetical protein